MAYTQADLDAIQEALASGALTVKHRDRQVTYRSLVELERVEAKIKAQLGQSGIRRNNPIFSNGY